MEIIQLRSRGLSQQEVADEVEVNRPVVVKWEARFREGGMAGHALLILLDESGGEVLP